MKKENLTEQKVLNAIQKHGGVAKYAAKELGVSNSTLLIRLRELGYERSIQWVKAQRKSA